jgi:hypothetical protein
VAAAASGGASNSSGGAENSSGGKSGGNTSSGGSSSGGVPSGSGGAETSGGSGGAATETGGAPASGGDGSGGGSECAADTETDPENCGSCGRECKVHEILGACTSCCKQGSCSDSFGDCIRESDGFETCADYCESIDEQCVQQGCGANTYRAWSAPDTCEDFAAAVGGNNDPCDTLIEFRSDSIRCCCTDHAP